VKAVLVMKSIGSAKNIFTALDSAVMYATIMMVRRGMLMILDSTPKKEIFLQ
jgi:Na+(H+)/acetate symporter ActP